jgi:hypothetical protein
MTHNGIYIKTIQNLVPKILQGTYNAVNSIFVTAHIDSKKLSVYHYRDQGITLLDTIHLSDVVDSKHIPLAINGKTNEVYVFDRNNKFLTFEYGKIVHTLLAQCWSTIQNDLTLYLTAVRTVPSSAIENAKEKTLRASLLLNGKYSISPKEVFSVPSIDLSTFVNSRFPLAELWINYPEKPSSRKRTTRSERNMLTFSTINEDHSVVSSVCKKLRVTNAFSDNSIIDFSSFYQNANPGFFLVDQSPLDNSWESKDTLFPNPEQCEWNTVSFFHEIPSMPEIE